MSDCDHIQCLRDTKENPCIPEWVDILIAIWICSVADLHDTVLV